MTELKLPTRGKNRKIEMQTFAEELIRIGKEKVGFKVSARGWCYQLEGFGLITKARFDLVENLINGCRRNGTLPIDFTKEEEGRRFSGVEIPEEETPISFMGRYLSASLNCGNYYTPDWWKGEEYYIQMVVEKIDLKTLFEPVCKKFHIPIATAKGWSSMLHRAEYSRRFKETEERGLTCVLLYCGDFDPDGLRISDFLRKNLRDLMNTTWTDGTEGYNPKDLKIDRFGLNYDFIVKNKLTWIDNLITGSKGYIAEVVDGKIVQGKTKDGKPHPNFWLPYAQEYLKKVGVRKCEANALVVRPEQARKLCQEAIEKYVGKGAEDRFQKKRDRVLKILNDFKKRTGLDKSIKRAIQIIEKEEEA